MKNTKRLLDRMDEKKIDNPHLKKLIRHLKENLAGNIDPLRLAPETAQSISGKWHHHEDHTDYRDHTDASGFLKKRGHADHADFSGHTDSSSDGPSHGDYCD